MVSWIVLLERGRRLEFLRWIQDAEGAIRVLSRKNGADGAAQLVAGFAVPNGFGAIQPDSIGQLYGID
jgi:hypothetical protein